MKDLLVKNVRIVDAQTDMIGQVIVRNGLFYDVREAPPLAPSGVDAPEVNSDNFEVINGSGAGIVIMPAFTDLHAHFREPGYTYKEDIASGSRAAVKGGYTTVVLMANTKPVCSTMNTVNRVMERAREARLIDIFQAVSITNDMKGENVFHLKFINDSVKFVSDDGKGVMNDRLMEEALTMSKVKNFIVMSHAEDHRYSNTDMRRAENSMTKRDIEACIKTGGRLHLAHVSTMEAMEMIVKAKTKGANITCEVTPHHLYTSDEITYKVNPPFRNPEDVFYLLKAIKDGYVDAIATDHAPHTKADKADGAPGISGIETAFQLCLTKLIKEYGVISLKKLSEIMSYNPSKMVGVNKGLIKQGYEADFIIADVNRATTINVFKFASKGTNTPFNGANVFGKILMTVKKGKVMYDERNV
ncbi:MAG: dihydroorotase [Synergistaceae bacterium]|nr:dihydroorotase [Synergistaceae bacterium]